MSNLVTFEEFEALYHKWLAARADNADPERDNSDKLVNERQDVIEPAARLLLSTPIPRKATYAIWWKWEVLESWADDNGNWADNRLTFALGCIKADLQRFSFSDV